MTRIAKMIPCLFVTFVVPALVPAISRADALDYLVQASANVMAAAREAGDVSGYGYLHDTSFLGAYLNEGAGAEFRLQLAGGHQYLFLGGGDDEARDVGIEVRDDDRQLVAASVSGNDPSLFFTPAHDGWYVLRLVLRRSEARASFAAMVLLSRDGFTVPVHNLTEAIASLKTSCQSAEGAAERSGRTLGFQDSPNQWGVFGAILHTGETAEVIHLHPGSGLQLFLAAGDNGAQDVDLFVTDGGSAVLDQDEAADNTPTVAVQTSEGAEYGVRTKVARSSGNSYTLVLTGVLNVR